MGGCLIILQVYVKDVKSSNGTFVNGERLSNEGEESKPKELHDQDEIEFGIDILNDNGASKQRLN
jgi:pSer/pThr/pTyr-binding forkhead associated (FHA) protein